MAEGSSTFFTSEQAPEEDVDKDGDSISDYWESDNVPEGIDLSSEEALRIFGNGTDHDQDGYSGLQEYNNGTSQTAMNDPMGLGSTPSTDKRVDTEYYTRTRYFMA